MALLVSGVLLASMVILLFGPFLFHWSSWNLLLMVFMVLFVSMVKISDTLVHPRQLRHPGPLSLSGPHGHPGPLGLPDPLDHPSPLGFSGLYD